MTNSHELWVILVAQFVPFRNRTLLHHNRSFQNEATAHWRTTVTNWIWKPEHEHNVKAFAFRRSAQYFVISWPVKTAKQIRARNIQNEIFDQPRHSYLPFCLVCRSLRCFQRLRWVIFRKWTSDAIYRSTGSEAGEYTKITVNNCEESLPRCILKRGTNATVTIEFKLSKSEMCLCALDLN